MLIVDVWQIEIWTCLAHTDRGELLGRQGPGLHGDLSGASIRCWSIVHGVGMPIVVPIVRVHAGGHLVSWCVCWILGGVIGCDFMQVFGKKS